MNGEVVEVYSMIRKSELPPTDYVERFYRTGGEISK